MNIELQNILNLFYLENKNSLYNDKEIKSLCDKQNFFGFSKTPYGKIGFPNIYCRWWDGNIILFGFGVEKKVRTKVDHRKKRKHFSIYFNYEMGK